MTWLPQNDGRSMAELQAGMNYSPSQPHVYPQENQWGQVIRAIAQAAPEVFNYIRQKQSDDIANRLMQEQYPGAGAGGAQELKMRMALEAARSQQQYREAQTRHYNEMGVRANGSASIAPKVDPETGMIWNGRQWVRPPKTAQESDRLPKLSARDMTTAIGQEEIHKAPDGTITWDRPGQPPMRIDPKSVEPFLNIPAPQANGASSGANDTNSQANGSTQGANDKFVVGKKYKDAQGRVRTYMGNGQWQ